VKNGDGIIMKYIEGVTINKKKEEWKDVSEKIKLKYMYQLADILNYLHGNGIIHRDLKPANIIINEKRKSYFYLILVWQNPFLEK